MGQGHMVVALVALALAGTGHDAYAAAEAMQLEVQVGTTRVLQLDVAVRRVAVANGTVAAVEQADPYTLEVRGLAVGRTLVVVWTDTGRQLLTVYVDPVPKVAPTQQGASPFHAPHAGRGQGLHIYRAAVRGEATRGGDVAYLGQEHSLSSTLPVLGGAADARVSVDVPYRSRAEITNVLLRYSDPLLTFELGDITAQNLTYFGSLRQLRGGLAGYHDAKYYLAFFGGQLRQPGADFWSAQSPLQAGLQSQFFAADNLTLTLQGTQTQQASGRAGLTTVSPAVHWLPTSSMMLDAEGGVHQESAAGRVSFSYDAPILSVNGLYQLMGRSYLARGTPRSEVAQGTVVLTPSAYYRLLALAGRSTSGASLIAPRPVGESRFYEAVASFFPDTGSGLSRWDARYRDNLGLLRDAAQAVDSRRRERTAEVGYQDGLPWDLGHFRIAVLGSQTDQRLQAVNRRDRQRALGGQGDLWLPFGSSYFELHSQGIYERRYDRLFAPQRLPREESNFYSALQGVSFIYGPVLTQAEALWSRQERVTGTNDWLGGRVLLALRPTAAHELRADVRFFRQPRRPIDSWDDLGVPPRYYSGVVSYTYMFGSAVDAPGLLDMFTGASVRVVVFLDANENGERDGDEKGIEDVAVVLDGDDRTDSDGDGELRFSRLAAGQHVVEVDAATARGLRFTTPSRRQVWVGDEDTVLVEVGVSDRAQIYGVVFNDANLDGELQAGEAGIPNVRVILSGASGEQEMQSAEGSFVFRGLAPGGYTVGLDAHSLPSGYVLALGGSAAGSRNGDNGHGVPNGSNGYAKGGRNGANGYMHGMDIELQAGQVSSLRIPVRALRTLEGRVYLDRDRDGHFSAKDEPAANVTIRVGRRQVTTDNEGRYLVRNLPAGQIDAVIDPISIPAGRMLASPGQVRLQLPLEPSNQVVDFVLRAP